jgi:hypothetical protein
MKVYLPVRKGRGGLQLSSTAYGSRKDAEVAIHNDMKQRRHLNRSDYDIHEIGWHRRTASY